MNFGEVTVIIPAFNEESGIAHTLKDLFQAHPELNVIVVNDGSSDQTASVASKFSKVKVITHEVNRGYGGSLKTGMRAAKTKYLVWYDADGQHRPENLVNVVGPVLNGECDACFGVRGKGSAHTIKRIPGKWVLKVISQIVARRKIPDLNCGLRCFHSSMIKRYLHLLPDGFSASTTSTLLFIKRGYRVKFSQITTDKRIGNSTVKMFRDGMFTIKLILRIMILFDAFFFLSTVAGLQILIAIVYSISVMAREHNGVPVLGALIAISGILTFGIGIVSAQISQMRQEQFEFRALDE